MAWFRVRESFSGMEAIELFDVSSGMPEVATTGMEFRQGRGGEQVVCRRLRS